MAKRTGIAVEFWLFLKAHKAYWITPIVVAVLLLAGLIVLGSSTAAPFIYTLF